MRHNTFEELKSLAHVTKIDPPTRWQVRRERLLRWATLIEAAEHPVRLFHQIEFMPNRDCYALRSSESPLGLAFADPFLRAQGLVGDDYGSSVEFFELSPQEAHQILCDCHYAGQKPSPQIIASRIRTVASKHTLAERFASLRQSVAAWF